MLIILIYWSILMACQPIWGYFMLRDKGIYLFIFTFTFLSISLSFFTHGYMILGIPISYK